jgi:hypothetical protein
VIDVSSPQLVLDPAELPDLAPMIHRQRLIIEGRVDHVITSEEITAYLSELADVIEMTALMEPATHRSEAYGWAGWIHWETSGAHFYAWEEPVKFFSVDIYACKAFSATDALDFTAKFFDTDRCVAKAY